MPASRYISRDELALAETEIPKLARKRSVPRVTARARASRVRPVAADAVEIRCVRCSRRTGYPSPLICSRISSSTDVIAAAVVVPSPSQAPSVYGSIGRSSSGRVLNRARERNVVVHLAVRANGSGDLIGRSDLDSRCLRVFVRPCRRSPTGGRRPRRLAGRRRTSPRGMADRASAGSRATICVVGVPVSSKT